MIIFTYICHFKKSIWNFRHLEFYDGLTFLHNKPSLHVSCKVLLSLFVLLHTIMLFYVTDKWGFFFPILIAHWLYGKNSKGKESTTTILPVFSNPVRQYGLHMPVLTVGSDRSACNTRKVENSIRCWTVFKNNKMKFLYFHLH